MVIGLTKIFVFSDSHGCSANMSKVLRKEVPDMIIFLGDGEVDLESLKHSYPKIRIHSVRGNCDIYSSSAGFLILSVPPRKIFATHGHTYGVKIDPSLEKLVTAAFEKEADILLFGHTHVPFTDYRMGMEILNPGTIGNVENPTYGEVIIDGFKLRTAIKKVV